MAEVVVQANLDPRYLIDDVSSVFTPAVAVYPELIVANIQKAIEIAGDPQRMRPHCKTHKTIELAKLELQAGITKHKCATFPEAEMLAEAGCPDVLLAYNLVGPNVERFAKLQQLYPQTRFSTLVDHPESTRRLARVMAQAGQTAEALLDVDVGQSRTGIAPGPEAEAIYRMLHDLDGLRPGGFHVYDGHTHQRDAGERANAVTQEWQIVKSFLAQIEKQGMQAPRIVCGGTASFPCWCEIGKTEDPRIEASPGTFFLNDWNYYNSFPDIPFQPAAVLLTRVISKPKPDRITLDLGYKAVASDPSPAGRVKLLSIPDATIAWQNEEHLVLDTPQAEQYEPGDLVYAWAGHICPTCNLHQQLLVVENNRVVGAWQVVARDRIRNC